MKTISILILGTILISGCTSPSILSVPDAHYGMSKKMIYVSDRTLQDYTTRARELLASGGSFENPNGWHHSVRATQIQPNREIGYTFDPGRNPKIYLTFFTVRSQSPDQTGDHIIFEFDAKTGEIINTIDVMVHSCFPVE
jgi:hypothetical protein